MPKTPREFCPPYCLFLPDCCDIALRDCWHKDDVAVKPEEAHLKQTVGGKQVAPKRVTIVGTNNDLLYIKDEHGVSTVSKNAPFLIRK